jgi:predicted XRE-type DNA-binding protein
MQIQEWLSQNNKNQADLARMIGRDRVRAHRIVTKGSKPTDEEMLNIFNATSGQVTANDFYELPTKPKRQGVTHD